MKVLLSSYQLAVVSLVHKIVKNQQVCSPLVGEISCRYGQPQTQESLRTLSGMYDGEQVDSNTAFFAQKAIQHVFYAVYYSNKQRALLMGSIAIPLPTVGSNQDIEVDIRVNGQLQQQNYRVEIFYWQNCQTQHSEHHRAECIREILASYDPDWQLYHIGSPTETFVPITFVKRPTMKRTA